MPFLNIDLVHKCAKRAIALAEDDGIEYDMLTACMDLEACFHTAGVPLDLQKLLDAGDGNFGHDVFGIRRHMNRETGKLEGAFLPRCALPQKSR